MSAGNVIWPDLKRFTLLKGGRLVVDTTMSIGEAHFLSKMDNFNQAGFGDVFPGSWYMTNGQIQWDVRELEENYTSGGRSGIDFDSGHYILEVNADVGNSLGEREELLFDNIDTKQVNVMD